MCSCNCTEQKVFDSKASFAMQKHGF